MQIACALPGHFGLLQREDDPLLEIIGQPACGGGPFDQRPISTDKSINCLIHAWNKDGWANNVYAR